MTDLRDKVRANIIQNEIHKPDYVSFTFKGTENHYGIEIERNRPKNMELYLEILKEKFVQHILDFYKIVKEMDINDQT